MGCGGMKSTWVLTMLLACGGGREPLGDGSATGSSAGEADEADEAATSSASSPLSAGVDSSSDDPATGSEDPSDGDDPPPSSGCTGATPAATSCGRPTPAVELIFSSASAQNSVIAVDDDSVFVVTNRSDDGEVVRVEKCDGAETTLANGVENPGNVVVSDEYVFWTDFLDTGAVYSVSKSGGDRVALASANHPLPLVLVGDDVVFSSDDGIYRVPQIGGAVERFEMPTTSSGEIRFDGELVFYAEASIDAAVGWLDPETGEHGIVVDYDYSEAVVVDCDYVVWVNPYGEMQRTSRQDGETVQLTPPIYRIEQDEDFVYASVSAGEIWAVPKDGSEIVTVASGLAPEVPWRVVADEQRVYWSSASSGNVYAAAKPAS
jgi:hypothetical protein